MAVVQRIPDSLRNSTHVLRRSRGERQQMDCGRYYVIDPNQNVLLWHHVNPEAYARELGVLYVGEVAE